MGALVAIGFSSRPPGGGGGGAVASVNGMTGAVVLDSGDVGAIGTPPASDALRWVSGTGDDANDGLTQSNPKRTLQAAYTSLPDVGGPFLVAGGSIRVGPGRYDVVAGWNLTRGKAVWIEVMVGPPSYISSGTTAPLRL